MQAITDHVEDRLSLLSKVNRLSALLQNSNPQNKKMTPIDFQEEEVLQFLRNLSHYKAKYILVGGFAMAFHGYVRATNDLDLWIQDTPENLTNFRNTLIHSGVVGLDRVNAIELIAGFSEFKIGNSGFIVEPMKSLKAFSAYDFDACYQRAKRGQMKGVAFKVIDAQDMLREKRATNRPKDQGDIEFLEDLTKR
jgi:hypothetical protein